MGNKEVFKFKTLFYNSDKYMAGNIGTLKLASGKTIKIVFTPEGLRLIIPKQCIENKDIVWLEDIKYEEKE